MKYLEHITCNEKYRPNHDRNKSSSSAQKDRSKGRILWFDSRVGGPGLEKDRRPRPQFTPEPSFHSLCFPNLQFSTSHRCRVSRQYTARYVTGAPLLPHFSATRSFHSDGVALGWKKIPSKAGAREHEREKRAK